MSESLIKVPGYKIPGYGIEREIGRGGMATVYLALQESLNRHVVLKVMNPVLTTDEDFKARFLNEGHIIGQLSHSNIVTVFDIGAHNDHYYLSMELLRGGSLRDKISQGVPLGMGLKIAKALGKALGYAHQSGFIHRDIKPLNVLFREDGSPVLTDFGIAKALGSSSQLTRTGYAFGSVGYMSPEQALGKPIDHRADIYSFGVMFWEVLTGDRLYESADAFALALKHATAPIPALPPGLQAFQPVMQKLLAKQAEDRYDNAEQFVADIERLQFELALTDAALTNPTQAAVPDKTVAVPATATGSNDLTMVATTGNKTYVKPSETVSAAASKASVQQGAASTAAAGGGGKFALLLVAVLALAAGGYFVLPLLQSPVDPKPIIKTEQQTPPTSSTVGNTTQTASNSQTNTTQTNTTQTSTNQQPVSKDPITADPTTTTTATSQQSRAQQIATLLEQGQAHLKAGRFSAPAEGNAFKSFSEVRALDPDNAEARQALLKLGRMAQVQNITQKATEQFEQEAFAESLETIAVGLRLQADSVELLSLQKQVQAALQETTASPETPEVLATTEQTPNLEQLLAQAQAQWDAGKRLEPPGDNAFDSYQQILSLDASNQIARKALLELGRVQQVQRLLERANELLKQGDNEAGLALVAAGLKIAPENAELLQLREQLQAR